MPPTLLAENQEPAPEPWVRELKRLLDVASSGEYDDPTIAVVRRFQEDNGIPPADGRVGERTWVALRDELCGNYEF